MSTDWLTATEAARLLAVKPETLYAYVSRGAVRSERTPGERRSRYARADVERLAARQRSGGRAGGQEIIVESALTLIEPAGKLYYRGWDVERAAEESTFETVASWLWTGERDDVPFTASAEIARSARRVVAALGDVAPVDALRVVLAAIRPADPLRHDRRPAAVADTGRTIVATLVDTLPRRQPAPRRGSPSVAERLWGVLTERPPTKRDVRLIDATLILLADHELAASNLAARVAASTWADPYLVVQAGLAALGGPLHGGASEEARRLVREVRDGSSAAEAIGARLAAGALVPGFGHRVYRARDPRADVLLRLLPANRSPATMRAGTSVLDTMRARALPFPNIDFSIALLAESYDMVRGAGELLFAISRTVGWLAHAIEEYEHRLRFRPRATYVGPPPDEA
jgi:citrate synthase